MTSMRSSGSLGQQLDHGVLAVLRGAADRVERAIARRQVCVAVPIAHRRAEHVADLQRLRHQHRRLVGEADALEVHIRIEAGRDAARNRARKPRGRRRGGCSRRRAPLRPVVDDQIAAARVCSACDAVACVSSCQYLPWMIDGEAVLRVALRRSSTRSAPSRTSCPPACSRARSVPRASRS